MTDRIMLCTEAGESAIGIRTVRARMKSPRRFYIGYDEFDWLQQDGWTVSANLHSFVKLRLDTTLGRIVFMFTWLDGHDLDRVVGIEQAVTLRRSVFREFLQNCRRQDGPRTFRALSLDTGKGRPRLCRGLLVKHTGGRSMSTDLKTADTGILEEKYWYAKQPGGSSRMEIFADYRDGNYDYTLNFPYPCRLWGL